MLHYINSEEGVLWSVSDELCGSTEISGVFSHLSTRGNICFAYFTLFSKEKVNWKVLIRAIYIEMLHIVVLFVNSFFFKFFSMDIEFSSPILRERTIKTC